MRMPFLRTRQTGAWKVEAAREEDAAALSRLHAAAFARGWTDGEFSLFLADPACHCFVARRGKAGREADGFVVLRQAADEAEVISIAVDQTQRRKGIARQLMDSAIRHCSADRIRRLFLEVNENNIAAIALYRRLGFREVSRRIGYYQTGPRSSGPGEAAIIMKLDLD